MPASKHTQQTNKQTKPATIFDTRTKGNEIGWNLGRKNHSSIVSVSSLNLKEKQNEFSLKSYQGGAKRMEHKRSLKREAIPVPTSVPNKYPQTHSFFLVVHI